MIPSVVCIYYFLLVCLFQNMASANLKAFVSEKELTEQRERRQAEWEKVRTADQPEGLYRNLYIMCDFEHIYLCENKIKCTKLQNTIFKLNFI